MTEAKLDYLNIALMLIALIAAFTLPFEVFLLSYAILGPLHYLTQISWMHDRQYFMPKKYDFIPLLVLSIAITLATPMILGDDIYKLLLSLGIADFFMTYGTEIVFVAFATALSLILTNQLWKRTCLIVLAILTSLLLRQTVAPEQPWDSMYWSIFALYLPTLIHVYLFTLLFILYGALKRQSVSGYMSVAVMLICAASCFLLFRDTSYYQISEWGQENFEGSFQVLGQLTLFHLGSSSFDDIMSIDFLTDPDAVILGRFIAFAYTYHYLNWFSKTKLIGWHNVPRSRFVAVIAIWLLSISIYLYDYGLGFRWLFLLSIIHVLLEFPLNHHSIIGIAKEIRHRINKGNHPAQ